jgi:paired amphipathic helix protein Sin3a
MNQVEAARNEQMAKRPSLINPLYTGPRHHLELVVDDVSVLQ